MGLFPTLKEHLKNYATMHEMEERGNCRIIKDEPNYILTVIFSHRVFEAVQREF